MMFAGLQRHELKDMQKDDSFLVPPHVFHPDDHYYCLCFRGHHVNQNRLVHCGHHVYLSDDLNRLELPVPRVKRRAEGGYFFRPAITSFSPSITAC